MSRTPIHPGEILKDELEEIGISAAELARQLRVPENRMSEVMRGRRNITADTALRLGKWFGSSAVFWMNLQKNYELRKAEQEIGADIDQIKTRVAVAG
ncbi:HigA family addiction module antitoxin [Lentilitoribacter sp. Alg239-R112]|jgi:addiction module HigA family antidote|uniref:HigA family addiction module antitoxin n=1 Tax=Lentilitoribacter sp. Alg239-R112 TaxID=2305987 RepID=UPI0013A6C4CC|nr:HigA family addiction module antitoxin [Lentilitoribacter sp. Alg239-R112]